MSFPDFVVIGAARCGTSTLYVLLRQIPSICLTDFKECNFFIEQLNYSKGRDWYENLFADKSKVCGDISPLYSMDHKFGNVAKRLKKNAPDVRIIYIVRDPVERAWSHYQQSYFSEPEAPLAADLPNHDLFDHISLTSSYLEQLEPYLELFPSEHVLILRFKQLKEDPKGFVKRICKFVEADVSSEQLEALEVTQRNSTEILSQIPSWWLKSTTAIKQSDSILVRRAVKLVPKSAIKSARNLVLSNSKKVAPTKGEEEYVKHLLTQRLADENDKFEAFASKRGSSV